MSQIPDVTWITSRERQVYRSQAGSHAVGARKEGGCLTFPDFQATLAEAVPPGALSAPLAALWWDAKGDWGQAHRLVDSLDTRDAMSVHAYLHRKEGADWNADYWYSRAGRGFRRPTLGAEWEALVTGLLSSDAKG
jgi:hypothetical protein